MAIPSDSLDEIQDDDCSIEQTQTNDGLSDEDSVDDIVETQSEWDVSDDNDSSAVITENTKIFEDKVKRFLTVWVMECNIPRIHLD